MEPSSDTFLRVRKVGGVVVAILLAAAPAQAQDPPPGTPEWITREAANFAATLQRPLDRLTQGQLLGDSDPQRVLTKWSPARGTALETRYLNRYGASIAVTLLRPNTQQRRLPSIVFVPGYGSGVRQAYHSFAQDLAEHGYLVLVFDPQAQGRSDARGGPETCQPGGTWQQPQEMGLREQGVCAGQPPQQAPAGDAGGTLKLATHGIVGSDADHASTAATYRQVAPTFVLGAIDATNWLLSDANPWRAWVDDKRLGIAGHSAGAYGAAQTANGDKRFRAAVALDGYHPVDLGVKPRVPTLWVQSEQENAPRLAPPANPRTLHPTWASFDAFRKAAVPAGLLTLKSSTHLDFSDAILPASRDGARVASYLELAWFDRFVKGDRDGTTRLFAERFDDSIDKSSIGTGASANGKNVPPHIGGRRIADALSYYYPGALAAFGADCKDLRITRCELPEPTPQARLVRRRAKSTIVALSLPRGDLPPVRIRGRKPRLELGVQPREITLRGRPRVVVVTAGAHVWRLRPA